jgi:hypothetical protein
VIGNATRTEIPNEGAWFCLGRIGSRGHPKVHGRWHTSPKDWISIGFLGRATGGR